MNFLFLNLKYDKQCELKFEIFMLIDNLYSICHYFKILNYIQNYNYFVVSNDCLYRNFNFN